MSRLLISPVSLKVNAVIIANCTEVQADGTASIADYPNLPEVNSSVMEYLMSQSVFIFYNISTNPKVVTIDLMTLSVQFSVSYKIHYKVSIVATSSCTCGQNRTVVCLRTLW